MPSRPLLLARPDLAGRGASEQAGAIVPSLEALQGFVASLHATNTPEIGRRNPSSDVYRSNSRDRFLLSIAREDLKFPRNHAAELLADNVAGDWRAVIEAIRLPTLVFGGAGSVHPPASQKWIADTNSGRRI